MAYYLTGDYYKGDYYEGRRGDPGIGSFLGGIAGRAFGMTPLGAGIGLLAGAITNRGPGPGGPPGGLHLPGTGTSIVPRNILPGRPSVFQPSSGVGGRGYHLNKSKHKAQPAHEKHSYYVRNRTRNPGNAKALRRAIRRTHAFVTLAKRALRGTGMTVGHHHAAPRRLFARKR